MAIRKMTVSLPDHLRAALQRAAARSGRSEADLVREGIHRVIEEYDGPEPRLPLFASGQPELARNVDEALAGFGDH